MALTPEDRYTISRMPDGVEATVEVRVRVDGGSLRLWPEGEVVDPDEASELVWDVATMPHDLVWPDASTEILDKDV